MSRWSDADDVQRGDDYDRRWAAMADAGQSVHGEADLVHHLLATELEDGDDTAVLDAGCGTGRVAIELARRDIDVHGVDLDEAMLDTARRNGPDVEWTTGDLAAIRLDRRFDLVVMAGNVMIFVASGTEGAVVENLASHLRPRGLLVAGFQLGQHLDLDAYDHHAAAAGLELHARWSTWARDPYVEGDYAVSVHRRS